MTEENRCKNCKYYREDEEYWHDHYLIPEHHYCIYNSYSKVEVDPNGYCVNYQSEKEGQSDIV